MPDRRLVAFVALFVACLAVAVGYAGRAVTLSPTPPQSADAAADAAMLAQVMARPHMVFLHSPGGDAYRQVAVLPLDALDGQRYLTPLVCQRVYMAAGTGLCMGAGHTATTFDGQFRLGVIFQQTGVPTRTRLAPGGGLGSMTWFVAGHSYADGRFSTQTLLVDPRTGDLVADLEQFTVLKDGAVLRGVDFNFWGVTFARDANRFYATLASGGKTYLLEGNVAERQARVLRENVECPSLSPDNTRLVFKKRTDPNSAREWRLAVLELDDLRESAIPGEQHSVDDQVEWLDNNHLLYAVQDEGPPATLAQNIWVASVDGSEPPRMLLRGALSPAVVR